MAGNQRSSSNGGQMYMHSNNGASGERSRKADFSELANVEDISEKLLHELKEEEASLRKQFEIELQKQKKLEKLGYELESKLMVYKDKIEDLNIKGLEKSIVEIKQNIEETIKSVDQMSVKAIHRSGEVRVEIQNLVNHFETRRLEFKSHKAVMNGLKTKQVQTEQYRKRVKDNEAELQRLDRELSRPHDLINLKHAQLILRGVEKEVQTADECLAKLRERLNSPFPSVPQY